VRNTILRAPRNLEIRRFSAACVRRLDLKRRQRAGAQKGGAVAKFIKLEDDVFVAPQLVEADFAEAAARGFRAVVNNRPDGEAADQLPTRLAEDAARRHGLAYHYLPVANANVTDDEVVEAFEQLMESVPRPALFYCRSGTRCSVLWAQASVARLGVERTLATTTAAGYDLEPLREQLEEREAQALSTPSVEETALLVAG